MKLKFPLIFLLATGMFAGCAKYSPIDVPPVVKPDTAAVLIKKELIGVANSAGVLTSADTIYYTYDTFKRLATRKYMDRSSSLLFFEKYTYNADGTVKQVDLTNRDPNIKSHYYYSYKADKVNVLKTDSTGAYLDSLHFKLDAKKLPITEDSGLGHYEFTHDAKGNVTARKRGGATDKYTYDTQKSKLANMPANLHMNYVSRYGTEVTTINNLTNWEQDGYPYLEYHYTYNSKGYPTKVDVTQDGKPFNNALYIY